MSGSWLEQLQQASWRGVPFSVLRSDVGGGRKTATHGYPKRDLAWVEDMGKKPKPFSFTGYLVGDDCFDQEQTMHAAADTEGPGVLVHPTFGTLNVSLLEFTTGQDFERGRTVAVNFTFLQGTPSAVFPSTTVSTQDGSNTSADNLDDASASDFDDDIADAVEFGAQVFDSIVGSLQDFGALCETAVQDAGLIFGAVAQLIPPAGYTFGQYSAGALISLNPNIATVGDALAEVTTAQGVVADAAQTAVNAEADDSTAIAADTQALVQSVQAAAVDPVDQVRLLTTLAGYTPTLIQTQAPIGAAIDTVQAATSALCRRAALACIGRACSAYNLTSSNQAITLRNNVAALFDAEILVAGDADDVASYQALRQLRTSILLDLNTRAAQLPALRLITTQEPMPALTLAYALYVDAARCDDLAARSGAINPLFLPVSFVALSA